MKREDVEALRARVLRDADNAAGRGVKLADMTFSVEGDILDALCRAWLALEDGHDVLVTHWERAAFAIAKKPVPRIGSIVRLVPEAGQE